jgi:hypothetical protein
MLGRRGVSRALAVVLGAATLATGAVVVASQGVAAAVVTNPGSVSIHFAGTISINGTTPVVITGVGGDASGTIDGSGNLSLPAANINFPPFPVTLGNVLPSHVMITPNADWSGNLDPDSGALSISAPLTAGIDLSGLDGVSTSCPVGPLDLNLTTGTSGTSTGTSYDNGTGTADLVDGLFAIPAVPTSPTPPTCPGAATLNSLGGLPIGSGVSSTNLTATFTPVILGNNPPNTTTTTGGSTTTTAGSTTTTTTTTGSTTTTTTVAGGPTISVGDASAIKPITGSVRMPFVITLSEPATTKVSVHFTTMDGTAIQNVDYRAKHGSVSFSPGQTSKTVNVTIKRMPTPEPNKTFTLELSLPKNASIADGEAVGTIIDNGPVGISISDASLAAPASRSKSMVFTISLTKATTHTVKVNYTTEDLTAHQPVDYTAKHGTVSITAGHTSVNLSITIKPDPNPGPDKVFIVQLSLPSGALIVDGLGAGTILLS